MCVQRFDDSLNSAIHTTYRISLRSSSMPEPRDPLLKVLIYFVYFRQMTTRLQGVCSCPPAGGPAEETYGAHRQGGLGLKGGYAFCICPWWKGWRRPKLPLLAGRRRAPQRDPAVSAGSVEGVRTPELLGHRLGRRGPLWGVFLNTKCLSVTNISGAAPLVPWLALRFPPPPPRTQCQRAAAYPAEVPSAPW